MLLLELTLSTEKKLRLFQDTPAHISRSFSPGAVQVRDLAAREVVLRDGLRQDLAVLPLCACQRHQVLDRRLGRNAPGTDVLLDRLGQDLHQREPLRNPAHAPVKPLRQILVAQGKIAQFMKQPPLLDRRLRVRCAQRPVEDQGVRLAHVPHRGLDCVRAQSLQQAHALVAVDDLVPAWVLEKGYHHDRHLLTFLGERGHKPPLSLRAPQPQVLVPHVELVKFQIHPRNPRAAGSTLAGSHTARRGSLAPHAADQPCA